MKKALGFAALTVVSIVLLALAATRLVTDAEGQQAIWMSAGIAIGVQLVAYGFTRVLAPANVMAGWGAGILLRFLTLAFHALLGVRIMGLPQAPALMSLAGFLFVTTLFEPLFLPKPQ